MELFPLTEYILWGGQLLDQGNDQRKRNIEPILGQVEEEIPETSKGCLLFTFMCV